MKKSFKCSLLLAVSLVAVQPAFAQINTTQTPNRMPAIQQKGTINRGAVAPKTDEEKIQIIRKQIIENIKAMPEDKRREAFEKSWADLPEHERQKIKDKIKERWDALPEEEKENLRNKITESWKNLPQAQKDEVNRKIKENIEKLSEEDKKKFQDALRNKIRNMTPEEKDALRNKIIEDLKKADAIQDEKDAAKRKLFDTKQ